PKRSASEIGDESASSKYSRLGELQLQTESNALKKLKPLSERLVETLYSLYPLEALLVDKLFTQEQLQQWNKTYVPFVAEDELERRKVSKPEVASQPLCTFCHSTFGSIMD
ncbi:hypothetical protein H0H87_009141, partial [Tephrocybe sp. NHM501043]